MHWLRVIVHFDIRPPPPLDDTGVALAVGAATTFSVGVG